MWYSLEINTLVWLLLSDNLRKPRLLAFIWALVKPLVSLHYTWTQYREDNIYKLHHNGQVCYLEKALNDRFDGDLRRIYIGDGTLYDTVYVYTEAENQPEPILNTEEEADTLWVYTEGETADTGADFIVYVPDEIMQSQNYAVRALIDYYKLGGKRYIIIETYE